jgi:hypothetical protein
MTHMNVPWLTRSIATFAVSPASFAGTTTASWVG